MRRCTALLVVCTGLIAWIAGVLPASAAPRRVVLLYDERPELPGLALVQADFVRTLSANAADPIEVYNEAMDRSRFGSGGYPGLLREFLRAKYADKKIDVAIAIMGPALDFLLSEGPAIFPGTPIVFCGIDRTELGNRSLPPYVRGILGKREFAPTLELALGLHPGTERVIVVAGTSEFDTRLLAQARNEFRVYEERLHFSYLTMLPLRELLAKLSQLPPRTIVLYLTLFQDGAGESFVPHDVAERVSAAASVPTYGFLDQYLGRGIVGGYLYSFSAHGTEAAKLTLRILAGTEPSGPRLSQAQTNKVLFDWRQLQRWRIGESRLPPGSDIRFRDPSAWDRYKMQIVGSLVAILAQASLIGWLLHERQYRRRAERAAREHMSELTQMNRMATAGELSATIAHEVNQPLTGIVTRANAALRWLSRENPDIGKARNELSQIVSAGHRAGDVVATVRGMFRKDTQDKTPLDINKLVLSVVGLLDVDMRKLGIESRMDLADRLPLVVGNEVQLQQVILNLAMNAIESMSSTQPRVLSVKSESNGDDSVRVSIEDTGSGIDPSCIDRIFKPLYTTKARGMGMGLSICHSIIESHDGRIWVSPAASRGSVFQFELPAGGVEHSSGTTEGMERNAVWPA